MPSKKIHTPSEQPATAEKSSPVEPVAPISGPLQWRDRITEIDAESKLESERHNSAMTALDTERAELVQKLASEGLALIERKAEPVEDMSDYQNWKAGDLLTYIGSHHQCFTNGEQYKLESLCMLDHGTVTIAEDDDGDQNGGDIDSFRWHSRPTN